MIDIHVSTVIAAPLDAVWRLASDFNGLPRWHPAATDSRIEEGAANNQIGCVRNFALADGSGRVRESLLALSAPEHDIVYDMLEAPLPFLDYVAHMHFEPITDGHLTFARWTARFRAGDGQSDHWRAFVADEVFLGGFKALEVAARGR